MDDAVGYWYDSVMVPLVLFAARTPCAPTWEWVNPAGHRDCLNLWLVVGGRGRWAGSGFAGEVGAGDCFVQRLWEPCHGTTDPDDPLVVLWANIGLRDAQRRPLALARLTPAILPPLHRRIEAPALAWIERLTCRMIERFEADDRAAADRWLGCVWEEITPRTTAVAIDADLAALVADIRARPEQPWRVAGLARAAGEPVARFSRRFRTQLGLSPRAFLVRARLERAKSELRMSSLPIGTIAAALGFCDIYHFSRRFRQHVGCSPRRYRAGDDGRSGSSAA